MWACQQRHAPLNLTDTADSYEGTTLTRERYRLRYMRFRGMRTCSANTTHGRPKHTHTNIKNGVGGQERTTLTTPQGDRDPLLDAQGGQCTKT